MSRNTLAPSASKSAAAFRVLLADPDESLPPVYREPLAREGFEVVPARSGLECVARLREHVPDALVLEPQLPWGGGDGVLEMMAEVPHFAAIPVMVLTSCRDPHVFTRLARFPIRDYQMKPLAPERLADRLHGLVAHPGRSLTLAEQTGRLECAIARRTGGRVRGLRVEVRDGCVIVSGRADSYHVKQLALAVVLEAFEASESQSERIKVNITVRVG